MRKKDNIEYITRLVQKGGPEPNEYDELTGWFNIIGEQARKEILESEQLHELWDIFGDALSPRTLQGFVLHKPHGYAGDYEIIDKIYTRSISHDPQLTKWDLYFHFQKAVQAVRNRKKYFINTLSRIESTALQGLKILNVGSGPGRDIYEYCNLYPESETTFDCVDSDSNAITFAKALYNGFAVHLTFYHKNIFRFKSDKSYDLVWSAGLFDYFDDKLFKYLLLHLFNMVCDGGKLVIGNFSTSNPSRNYMELGEWFLKHRDEHSLKSLALDCGIHPDAIHIEAEPEGINLFLQINKQ
jgi:extracellular factor (EF) 3-hydroxypalmitic acid methyl ester biosynthesis protein